VISVVTIGVLEILQLWAPGRHARFEDFVVDALAACAGLAVAAGMDWVIQRSRRSSASAT
jgi:VanZ family protein